MRKSGIRTQVLVIVLAFLVIAGLLWVNLQFARNNPGGNDFLVHYIGTRSFIYDGLSPYSDEVAAQIQTAAYGHPARGGEHELRVAYPLYSVVFFAPFSLISDYQVARATWMTLLEISLVALCFLSFELVDWKPGLKIQAAVLLFSLLWYHAVRGVVNGNAVVLLAFLITLVFYLIKTGHDQGAGIMLALTTIKPHLVVLLVIYILVWAVIKKRKKIIGWFFAALFALFVFAWLLIPNWILQNIWEILRYPAYNPAGTLAAALSELFPGIGGQLKWGIAITLCLLLVAEWSNSNKGNFDRFLWVAMLTLVVSQWIGIQTDPGNFIILFPAVIMILAVLSKKWRHREAWVVGGILGVLLVGLWGLFVATIQRSYQPIQNPVMFLPLPAFCLVGLYWIKWWVVGTRSPLQDYPL